MPNQILQNSIHCCYHPTGTPFSFSFHTASFFYKFPSANSLPLHSRPQTHNLATRVHRSTPQTIPFPFRPLPLQKKRRKRGKRMLFPLLFAKLAQWLLYKLFANSIYRASRKMQNYTTFLKHPSFKPPPPLPQQPIAHHEIPSSAYPNLTKTTRLENLGSKSLVCDVTGTLLSSPPNSPFFPYFMLVAFEGGSILRAFLLLLSYPLLSLFDNELSLKVMIFITFCGLRMKDMDCVSRAVLPKFYLENLNDHVYQVLAAARSKVVVTSVPRVMIHEFLKEYLGVDHVIGTELKRCGSYFTGFVSDSGLVVKYRAAKAYFGEELPDVGLSATTSSFSLHDDHDQLFLSLCKEAYVVNNGTGDTTTQLPRSTYPKPLIFHDGRLAFLPTPLATLTMLIWLPIGILLSIFRLLVGILLPYEIAVFLGTLSGLRLRLKHDDKTHRRRHNTRHNGSRAKPKGVLYVCTHRTLLDPVMLGLLIAKPLIAVTYSLSKMSEVIAPLKTVRLARDRNKDGETMQKLISEGDLVVCPEGTTCREPYLLRFSPLFAELADDIVPVAVNVHVDMLYGTTASGFKCLDPFFFLMNPRPSYYVHVLGKVPKEETCAGGRSSSEVANFIQRQLGDALGFECTKLTRKDKYLMLAGNEGIVGNKRSNC